MQQLSMPGRLRADHVERLDRMLAHVRRGQPIAHALRHHGGTARRRGLRSCIGDTDVQRARVPGGLRDYGLDRLEHLHRHVRWRLAHAVALRDDASAAWRHHVPQPERDARVRHGPVPGALRRYRVEQLDDVHADVRRRRADALAHGRDARRSRWLYVPGASRDAGVQ